MAGETDLSTLLPTMQPTLVPHNLRLHHHNRVTHLTSTIHSSTPTHRPRSRRYNHRDQLRPWRYCMAAKLSSRARTSRSPSTPASRRLDW